MLKLLISAVKRQSKIAKVRQMKYLYFAIALAVIALSAAAARKVMMGASLDLLGIGFLIGCGATILSRYFSRGDADTR